MVQKNVWYTKEHEWVSVEGDTATVGISDHAQQALGDITFVDLPKPGKVVKAHDSLAVIESVKAASDVYAPVGGTVCAANDALGGAPETINHAPHGEGWLCKLKPFDAAGLATLMTAEQYEAFLAES